MLTAKSISFKIYNILPEKRYLPVGFDIDKKVAKKKFTEIKNILTSENELLSETRTSYRKSDTTDGKYSIVNADTVISLLQLAYEAIEAKEDGMCNLFSDIEPIFWFSLSERMKHDND